jgi:hypothetical protein
MTITLPRRDLSFFSGTTGLDEQGDRDKCLLEKLVC